MVNLQLDLTGATHAITGSATLNRALPAPDASPPAPLALRADLNPFAAAHPAPAALGRKTAANYTLAFPHSADSPKGDGFGTLTVTPAGAVHFVGTLGDGTAVTQGTSLSGSGDWPFFALLYGNKGLLCGELVFNLASASQATITARGAGLGSDQTKGCRVLLSRGIRHGVEPKGASWSSPLRGAYTLSLTAGGLLICRRDWHHPHRQGEYHAVGHAGRARQLLLESRPGDWPRHRPVHANEPAHLAEDLRRPGARLRLDPGLRLRLFQGNSS